MKDSITEALDDLMECVGAFQFTNNLISEQKPVGEQYLTMVSHMEVKVREYERIGEIINRMIEQYGETDECVNHPHYHFYKISFNRFRADSWKAISGHRYIMLKASLEEQGNLLAQLEEVRTMLESKELNKEE